MFRANHQRPDGDLFVTTIVQQPYLIYNRNNPPMINLLHNHTQYDNSNSDVEVGTDSAKNYMCISRDTSISIGVQPH
jgi:hypothetical protein